MPFIIVSSSLILCVENNLKKRREGKGEREREALADNGRQIGGLKVADLYKP